MLGTQNAVLPAQFTVLTMSTFWVLKMQVSSFYDGKDRLEVVQLRLDEIFKIRRGFPRKDYFMQMQADLNNLRFLESCLSTNCNCQM